MANINHYNNCLNEFLEKVNIYSENTKIVQICTLNMDKNLVAQKVFNSIL